MDSLETKKQHKKYKLAPVQNALFYRLSTSLQPMTFYTHFKTLYYPQLNSSKEKALQFKRIIDKEKS